MQAQITLLTSPSSDGGIGPGGSGGGGNGLGFGGDGSTCFLSDVGLGFASALYRKLPSFDTSTIISEIGLFSFPTSPLQNCFSHLFSKIAFLEHTLPHFVSHLV